MTTSQGRDSRGGGGRQGGGRRFTGRRRRQCVCKEVGTVGYKDISVLRRFISDRGRIESGRKSGNCAKCQRELSTAISRARFLALLPYAPNHQRVTGSIAPATAAKSEDEEDSSDEDADTEDQAATETTAENEEQAETESSADEDNSEDEQESDESEDTSDSVESSEEDSGDEEESDSSSEDSDEDEAKNS